MRRNTLEFLCGQGGEKIVLPRVKNGANISNIPLLIKIEQI
jgi:hypothetical protein